MRKHKMMKKTLVTGLALSMLLTGATSAMADDYDDDDVKFEFRSSDDWKFGDHKGRGRGKGKENGKGHGKDKKEIVIKLDFDDIDEDNHWAMEYIAKLSAKQVFSGYEDGTFKPNKPVSRIETVITAIRLMGLKAQAESSAEMNTELNFKDANEIEKKYPQAIGYVAVALENDLFSETEEKLQADKSADRLWATILLVKALGLEAEAKAKMNTKLDFKDAHEIPAGAVGYVEVAVEKGIVTGYDNNTFKPNKPVTRAELAVLLDRAGGELPDYTDGTTTGEITSISGNQIQVKYGTTLQTYSLHANVFVHHKGQRLAASALSPGDEIIISAYEGTIVFIEVTKLHNEVDDEDFVGNFTVNGKIHNLVFNASNLLTELEVRHTVNGTTQTTKFAVDSTVDIWGSAAWLNVNQDIKVKGTNGVLKEIELVAPDRDFAVTGVLQGVTKNSTGKITSIDLLQQINNQYKRVNFKVEDDVEILGNYALFVNGRTLVLSGEGITADKIQIQADNIAFTVTGTLESTTINSIGQLSTIAIKQQVNGSTQVSLYNIAPNVVIDGNTALLVKDQEVELTGTNQTINRIEIVED
jgi:predicted DNA-binding antitoxin AbrB/MazE fold protein